jgi:hypothetical protein
MLVITRREFFAKTGASAVAMSVLAAQVARIKAAVAPLGLPLGSQTLRIACAWDAISRAVEGHEGARARRDRALQPVMRRQ